MVPGTGPNPARTQSSPHEERRRVDDDLDEVADQQRREDPAVGTADAPADRFGERDVEAQVLVVLGQQFVPAASVASGALDALPCRDDAPRRLQAEAKEAYLDSFVPAVVKQLIALVVLILMASLFDTF
jgi:hypothetical protein